MCGGGLIAGGSFGALLGAASLPVDPGEKEGSQGSTPLTKPQLDVGHGRAFWDGGTAFSPEVTSKQVEK